MANLIITVISIALVAVTAVAGMYYGNVAYQDYYVKSKATEIISRMQQIKIAANLWQSNNGGAGSYPTTYAWGNPGAVCGNSQACWTNNLTNNSSYLQNVQTAYASQNFYPPIDLGNYGRVPSNEFYKNTFEIQQNAYVAFYASLNNYTNYNTHGLNQTSATPFFKKLCNEINKQLNPDTQGLTIGAAGMPYSSSCTHSNGVTCDSTNSNMCSGDSTGNNGTTPTAYCVCMKL